MNASFRFQGGRWSWSNPTFRTRSSPDPLLCPHRFWGIILSMGFLNWASDNWFILLQSLGIIGGLLFTAASLRLDEKTRRVGNLMAITKNHREIWTALYDRPELSRVLDAD